MTLLLAASVQAAEAKRNPVTVGQHWNHVTRSYQDQVFRHYPIPRIHRCAPGCEWGQAIDAYHRAKKWRAVRLYLAHPSIPDCWAMAYRAFWGTGLGAVAHYVIDRESGCFWNANNPYSSALGVGQMLDTWGSDAQRRDAAWSLGVMRRYFIAHGGPCTAWC